MQAKRTFGILNWKSHLFWFLLAPSNASGEQWCNYFVNSLSPLTTVSSEVLSLFGCVSDCAYRTRHLRTTLCHFGDHFKRSKCAVIFHIIFKLALSRAHTSAMDLNSMDWGRPVQSASPNVCSDPYRRNGVSFSSLSDHSMHFTVQVAFTYSHTHSYSAFICSHTPLSHTIPSMGNWGSVSCQRTLGDADWRSWKSKHRTSGPWPTLCTSWATAVISDVDGG